MTTPEDDIIQDKKEGLEVTGLQKIARAEGLTPEITPGLESLEKITLQQLEIEAKNAIYETKSTGESIKALMDNNPNLSLRENRELLEGQVAQLENDQNIIREKRVEFVKRFLSGSASAAKAGLKLLAVGGAMYAFYNAPELIKDGAHLAADWLTNPSNAEYALPAIVGGVGLAAGLLNALLHLAADDYV